MARPRVAIDAAVLAAAVRIDRAVEADIRRVVAGDDRPRRIHGQGRGQRRRLFVGRAPAVVERDAPFGFEASAIVARRAASLARPDCGRHIHAADNAARHENNSRTICNCSLAPLAPTLPSPGAGQGQGGGEGWGEGQVSVIIPTLNAADTLPGLIEQLRASTIVEEIIVVDGGSSDETVAIAPDGRRARHRGAARTGHSARRRRRRRGGRLAVVSARRLPPRTGLGSGRRCFPCGAGSDRPRRLFRLCAGRRRARRAAAGADRRLALPRSGAALWRSRSADRPQPLSRGRRLCPAAVDGRRRPRAPPRPPAARPHRRAVHLVAEALPPRRILASAAAQPLLPLALSSPGYRPDRIVRLYG